MKKLILPLLFTLLILPSALAQRTAPGSYFIGGIVTSSLSPAYGQGTMIEVGRYGLQNYIRGGIALNSYREPSLYSFLDNRIAVYERIYAEADYLYRLAGSYSRWFNLYAGGGLHMGVDEVSKVLTAFAKENPGYADAIEDQKVVRLTEGLQGIIEMEMFPFRRVGFTIGTRLLVAIPNGTNSVTGTDGKPVKYLTHYVFYPDIYCGIRIGL